MRKPIQPFVLRFAAGPRPWEGRDWTLRAVRACRRVLLVALALVCVASPAAAAEAYKVQVLPFRIHAPAADLALARQIAEGLARPLTAAGASVAIPDLSAAAVAEMFAGGADVVRDYARGQGLEYVVWGSATRIGAGFSLDARLLDVLEGRTETFYLDGQRAETLSAALRDLGREVAARIYRQYRVAAVRIEGNQRIEADAIQRVIRTEAGDLSDPKQLAADLKAVFAMGYFDDVRVERREVAGGQEVIFVVQEKPTVRVIRISGNRAFDDKDIKEAMTLRTGSILNEARLRNNLQRIETLYKDKNYHNVQVRHEIHPLDNNQADLEFTIEEGDKIRIERITFQGNEAMSDKELKKLMKTSEAWFLSWLTADGELSQEALNQDIGRIKAHYNNHGFIQAKVSDPQIEYLQDGIAITIKIEEGPQFKVGRVTVSGDLVQPAETLTARLSIPKEEFFSREVVRNDVLLLTDIYSDEGYAYADIVPGIEENDETLTVDIDFQVTKGPLVHFEKIVISGNTKTRDKVIRRQLEVYEQELYRGAKLKKGVRNLYRLDYFEDVKVDTAKGSTDDSMVLTVEVEEKPTGAFTFGGGYSSIEDVFAVFSVSQRNLFGRGQILQLRAQLGGTTNKYQLSFTEPWLFDIPLAATVDLYNWETDYDTYDKDSLGGGLRFSYPFWENVRVFWGYRIDVSDVREITVDASDSVKQMAGQNTTSSTEVAVRYDSRDRLFNPTEGSMHGISVEYAGLGGDVGFLKTEAETGWYFPLVWTTVGYLHAKGGHVDDVSGKLLPDYEKYYLGGINSLRGFRWRDLAPTEINSQGYLAHVGGEKYVQFNAEVIIPIEEKMGFNAVVFFDTGEVYSRHESVDLGQMRESVGAGIRWYSPLGPIRVEYGHILDPKPGFGEGGRWEFTMGSAF